MQIKFIGTQQLLKGKSTRLFNLVLADGRQPTFSVGPGESLKERMQEVQAKFAPKETA